MSRPTLTDRIEHTTAELEYVSSMTSRQQDIISSLCLSRLWDWFSFEGDWPLDFSTHRSMIRQSKPSGRPTVDREAWNESLQCKTALVNYGTQYSTDNINKFCPSVRCTDYQSWAR